MSRGGDASAEGAGQPGSAVRAAEGPRGPEAASSLGLGTETRPDHQRVRRDEIERKTTRKNNGTHRDGRTENKRKVTRKRNRRKNGELTEGETDNKEKERRKTESEVERPFRRLAFVGLLQSVGSGDVC